MDILAKTEELEIFATKVGVEIIDFSWDQFGKDLHYLGAFIHLIYVIVYWVYVNEVFLQRNFDYRMGLLRILGLCLIYPLVYECLQIKKLGSSEYFSQFWNNIDFIYVWIGISNLIVQRNIHELHHPASVVLMLFVTILLLIKSLFFLRIIHQLSFLVTMLKQVFLDLGVFIIFFMVLIFFFAISLSIIDLGNTEYSDIPYIAIIKTIPGYAGEEYKYLTKFLAHFVTVIRISTGDFNFDESKNLPVF
jgi:hypothetical protein